MAQILVVEDDPDVASLVSHVLGSDGHEITVATDGVAGLDAARALHPALVLLDWMMPSMSGIEVCATLRADVRFEDTKIVMLSARANESDRAHAHAQGADEYLTKPFSPRALRQRITELLA